jgi:hypothetical protein
MEPCRQDTRDAAAVRRGMHRQSVGKTPPALRHHTLFVRQTHGRVARGARAGAGG